MSIGKRTMRWSALAIATGMCFSASPAQASANPPMDLSFGGVEVAIFHPNKNPVKFQIPNMATTLVQGGNPAHWEYVYCSGDLQVRSTFDVNYPADAQPNYLDKQVGTSLTQRVGTQGCGSFSNILSWGGFSKRSSEQFLDIVLGKKSDQQTSSAESRLAFAILALPH